MPTAMPALDVDVCSGWTENDRSLYNTVPYYLAKMQVEKRKWWSTWGKYTKKRKWTPNKGDTLRAVRTEPSPHLRQFFYPTPLRNMPKKDVMNVREVKQDAQVYRHRFESPNLNFFPSFNDFMDHVDDTGEDITQKILRAEDLFIRTNVWQQSPFVFIATSDNEVALLQAPFWKGYGAFDPLTEGKTTAWLASVLPQVQGTATLTNLARVTTIMETDLRVPSFSGSDVASGYDKGLAGKYAFQTSSERYFGFTFDPYLQQHKNCDLDIVNQSFRGSLFGRVTCALEDLPMRCKADGTFAEPELRVEGAQSENDGETLPNSNYASPSTSPFEIGAVAGANGYESITVGPPPSKFTGDSPPLNFPKMFWNGEVKLSKMLFLECVDPDGTIRYQPNDYGEFLKFISQAAFGILPTQRRNIIPFIYLRKRAG
jgi:hypothetical protein